MKSRSLILAIVGLISSVGVAQTSSTGSLGELETIRGWQLRFKSFAQQSVDRRVQIQQSLPEFASRFVPLLLETPEYRTDRAFVDGLRNEIDGVMEGLVEGKVSKEDARKTLDALIIESKKWNEGLTKHLGQTTAQMFVQSIRLGMRDRDESVRNAAQRSLLNLAQNSYTPFRSKFRRRCGMRSDESRFRDLLVSQVSDLVREEARRQPKLFLGAIQSNDKDCDYLFLALAEAKSPVIRPAMVERARSGDVVGLEALINWPVPEGLEIVINRYRMGITEDEEIFETALLVYGERGLRKLSPIWSSLPESSRSLVYVAIEALPSKAAVDLLEKDAMNKRAEVRAKAASLLGYLLEGEWVEWFAGPDPKTMDGRRSIRLLEALARDPDPEVRETALGYLDRE